MNSRQLQIARFSGMAAGAVLLLSGCGTRPVENPGSEPGATRTLTIHVVNMCDELELL